VAIISDRAVIRHGLQDMLRQQPDRVMADAMAFNADGVLRRFDVVLYDLAGMADQSDGGLASIISTGRPVLALELFSRPDVTEHALALGAADAVPVDIDIPALVDAVERVASGRVLVPAEHKAALYARLRARYGLTDREATILGLVAAGLNNHEIASALFLSINSVKTYIRQTYRKIGARSRSEAVLWATRHDVIGLDPRLRATDTAPWDGAPTPTEETLPPA
jgi:two-component system, NarL family, response regulator LiaR